MIEASVGVGVGLIFLAREGLSFATLKRMPEEEQEPAARERRAGGASLRALACAV